MLIMMLRPNSSNQTILAGKMGRAKGCHLRRAIAFSNGSNFGDTFREKDNVEFHFFNRRWCSWLQIGSIGRSSSSSPEKIVS